MELKRRAINLKPNRNFFLLLMSFAEIIQKPGEAAYFCQPEDRTVVESTTFPSFFWESLIFI